MLVEFQGRKVEANEVDFLTAKEDFNEYQLMDGTVLKMKTVVLSVYKIEGEVSPEGDPVYNVQSVNLIRIKK